MPLKAYVKTGEEATVLFQIIPCVPHVPVSTEYLLRKRLSHNKISAGIEKSQFINNIWLSECSADNSMMISGT